MTAKLKLRRNFTVRTLAFPTLPSIHLVLQAHNRAKKPIYFAASPFEDYKS